VRAGILRHLRLLAGEAPPCAVELSGVLDASGLGVDALYVGSGINRDFLVRLVMDGWSERSRRRLASYGDVPQVVAAASRTSSTAVGPHVILTDLPALWGRLTPTAAQYRFPAWVRQEVTLPPAGERWVVPRGVEREAARFVRRHGYTVDFVTDVNALRRFFHELYRPYVLARFASEGIVVAEEEFWRKARGCTLARLHGQGEWLAGVLLELSRKTLRFGWFGARSEAPPPGASDVLDFACIRHARDLGIRRVQLGHSRPCLTDGVVRYKAKFGAQLHAVRYPQSVLGIAVDGQKRAVFDRLNGRQLIVVRRGHAHILEAR
jgi:hypothetical protein